MFPPVNIAPYLVIKHILEICIIIHQYGYVAKRWEETRGNGIII